MLRIPRTIRSARSSVLLLAAVACGSRSELLGADGALDAGGGALSGGGSTLLGGQAAGGMPVAGSAAGGAFPMGGAPPVGGFSMGGFGTAGLANGGFGMAGIAGHGGGGGIAGSSGSGGANLGGAAGAGGEGGVENKGVQVVWAKAFGDAQAEQRANAIAVEPSGIFTLTGSVAGNVDFGGGVLMGSGDSDMFTAQFGPDGKHRWAHLYGDLGYQEAFGIAVDGAGTLAVTGSMSGTADFGAGTLQSAGNLDIFVASFSHDSQLHFAKRFGDFNLQNGSGVAIGSGGTITTAAWFVGKVDMGGGALTSAGSADALLGQLDKNGGFVWNVQAGNQLAQRANAIAHSSVDGALLATGNLRGMLKWASCPNLVTKGEGDVWLAWLTEGGVCVDAARFGDAQDQDALAIATSKGPSHLVAIAGTFRGQLDIGGSSVTAVDQDAYVALFSTDPNSQKLQSQWIRRIGEAGQQSALGVAFDDDDNLVVVGAYDGEAASVGLPSAQGGPDAFAVRYDTFGNVTWAKGFGAGGKQQANAVGIDEQGNAYVAGSFEGALQFSAGALASSGADDIFVIKLAPH